MKPKATHLALIAPAMALLSCVPPKAIVVEETGPKPKQEKKQEIATAEQPSMPSEDDDGFRLPNMLGMPGDNEFRSNRPATSSPTTGSGGVIARPPVEPER